MSPLDLLNAIHMALLAGFASVALFLLGITVRRWMRIEGKVIAWRTGSFLRLPTRPLAFLVVVTALLTLSLALQLTPSPWIIAGYLFGGLCWLAASALSSTVVVTEEGLWTNIHDRTPAVCWAAVTDYFEHTEGSAPHLVFFLGQGWQRQRVAVAVPPAQCTRLQAVVRSCVDARFEWQATVRYGQKAANE
ncbi:MAG: hypothetical protein AAGI71_00380 [Bacteroidota bacterium]